MQLIDTHCHVSPVWYEPVENLLAQMDRNGVAQATLVQMGGQFNNDYQAECVRRFPDRLASVVLADSERDDAVDELKRLAEQGAAGVRLNARTRSPGDDPLAIWRAAEALKLPISCGGNASAFADDAFADIVQAVPTASIILEHLAGVNQPDGEKTPYATRRKAFGLARFPNVYIKVHGLGEFCARLMPVAEPFPFDRSALELLDLAVEAFGPERMMWGSDYPPVSGREGYANALRWTQEQLASYGDQALGSIFGGVAANLYGMG